jgi:hypothetical protein
MEKILEIVNENVQHALKKFQDTKNKEHEKTQKQVNELRGVLNKHQSETKDTIKREINEIKDENKKYKRGADQRYGKPQKEESNRNKNHSGRPLQQTRTSERQNLRTQR